MKLKQRIAEIDGKIIAYVETIIEIDGAKFTVKINEKQKPFYNFICKQKGFRIGELTNSETVDEKVLEI